MHTPGPWIADDVFVGTKTAERFHVTCRGEHAEADAALIAAAPDLLAALQKLVRAIDRLPGNNPLDGLADEARAAITNAMRGQP